MIKSKRQLQNTELRLVYLFYANFIIGVESKRRRQLGKQDDC